MPPMALLRHTLPDGTSHYDWLLARSERVGADERCLLTLRVAQRVDRLQEGAVAAERLPDHRGVYLEHEGPVSGGRGRVARVAKGECAIVEEAPDLIAATLRWEGAVAALRVRATREADGSFLVVIAPIVDDAAREVR